MNKINISGDISSWGYGSRWLAGELKNLTGEIEVYISSYGGDVFEGVDMYNLLRIYSQEHGKVTTIVNGKAMSIASLIYLAGDNRKAFDNSTIMIHKAWTWMAGNSDDLLQEAKILDSIDNILISEYSKYMSEDKKEIKDILSQEGWYIGRDELEATGFVDEFISGSDEVQPLALSKKAYAQNMDSFSAKAKEENVKPNFEAVARIIENMGGSQAETIPSDNVKLVNSNQGETMEFNEDNFKALVQENKVLLENRTTMQKRENTLSIKLENAEAALDAKNEEINALNAGIECKLSEAKDEAEATTLAMAQTRIKEAFVNGESSEKLILDMISAKTDEDASKLVIEAKESDNINQGDIGDKPKESGLLAYANRNKGSIL